MAKIISQLLTKSSRLHYSSQQLFHSTFQSQRYSLSYRISNDIHSALFSPHGMYKSCKYQCMEFSTSENNQVVASTQTGESIVNSPHSEVHIPEGSFTEFIFSQLDMYGHSVSMVDSTTDRHFSFSKLKELTVKTASALTKLGFKKGDTLLIFSTNCPEYAVFFMACAAIGATVTTSNPAYTAGELARQMKHSQCCAIATTPQLLQTVVSAVSSDPEISANIKLMISFGQDCSGCVPFSLLMEDDGKAFPDNVTIDPYNDILALPYSSGTTGLPKGVMLTHNNIIANICQLVKGPMCIEPGKDVLLGLLPFYHIYGMIVVQFGAICGGTKLVTMPKFEPESFLKTLQDHKISYAHLVPPLVLFLAKSNLVKNFDLRSLHSIVCGAAPLGDGLTQEVMQNLGATIIQAYGLTETSPVTHYDSIPVKSGTIGRLVPNTQAKIIDLSTGQTQKPGDVGEMVIKGPQVMKGYLGNEAATQDMIQDGWLHTGDIGHYDEEGYFVISDRLKELIKFKGFQVPPAELEALICTHPSVADVAVIGVPMGEDVGEVPRAFVVAKPNTKLQEEDVTQFVEENVAPYKRLRGGVKFVEAIPKTASGKILRRELKQL